MTALYLLSAIVYILLAFCAGVASGQPGVEKGAAWALAGIFAITAGLLLAVVL